MIRSLLICSRVIGAGVVPALLIATLCASGVPAEAWMPTRLACDFDANGRSDIGSGRALGERVGPRVRGHHTCHLCHRGLVAHPEALDAGRRQGRHRRRVLRKRARVRRLQRRRIRRPRDQHPGSRRLRGCGLRAVRRRRWTRASDDTKKSQVWHQDNVGTDKREKGDQFGSALAVGDFNGDIADDLAIGVPAREGGRAGRLLRDCRHGARTAREPRRSDGQRRGHEDRRVLLGGPALLRLVPGIGGCRRRRSRRARDRHARRERSRAPKATSSKRAASRCSRVRRQPCSSRRSGHRR